MIPNLRKTIIGMPFASELVEEPFQLRARMVRMPPPSGQWTITHVRVRVPTQPPARRYRLAKEFFVSAAVVYLIGCIAVGWLL